MSGSKNCPKCGAPLPPDAPGGYCARCLLQLGLGIEDTVVIPIVEKSGDRIGRYKLLQQIGEGGMGSVWMAEQQHPDRRVAIKLVKIGMDTKQVLARFHAEQQALALMDHPNIAGVFDAGATDNGRPYFVMELVRGIPITTYCDREKLTTRERLDLLVKVCLGVQHAHQKGVIHRDIKPSNILVTMVDGEAVPKIIDFGIAKAAQGKLVNETLFTAFEQFLGTPAYMSPEQAEMTALDVDIRSDIYSLGVLMYELLTGQTPFDSRTLLAAGIDEMRRTIREKEPAKPSTRLSKLMVAELTTTARQRRVDVSKLIRFLRGDLDCIVMKCLEKDRKRRYEAVSGLAMDIKRFLENQPVVARPPSNLYRLQKLVRRNRLPLAAVTLIALSLLLGTNWGRAHRILIHLYDLVKFPEVVISEVNFRDKQPQYYSAYGYVGKQSALIGNPVEETGAGPAGENALVVKFDTSYFTKPEIGNQGVGESGFGLVVNVPASADNWVNTTNLGLYKLYVTAKTTGLAVRDCNVIIQWEFLTHGIRVLTMDLATRFTTNYQTFSYVIGDGYMDTYAGNGQWTNFVSHFSEINSLQCCLNAGHWRDEYRLDQPSVLYISNVKFVRLTRPARRPETANPVRNASGVRSSIRIQSQNQNTN
jgi:serine/threonine protein kinase